MRVCCLSAAVGVAGGGGWGGAGGRATLPAHGAVDGCVGVWEWGVGRGRAREAFRHPNWQGGGCLGMRGGAGGCLA